jgi:di/tricarboxylate transporter
LRLHKAAANNMVHLSPTTVFDVQTLAAYAIFLASYLVFALGKFPGLKIDRAGAAIIGAVGMVAFRVVPPSDTLRFIDFPTLVLLFSMMLIVGNLHLVGFFEWNAEMVLRRLKPSRLLPAVVFTSGLLSAFFVNDIVCLVMVPFVLSITRRLRLEPVPYLLGPFCERRDAAAAWRDAGKGAGAKSRLLRVALSVGLARARPLSSTFTEH